MRSRCMSLLPRTTLHSDSEHLPSATATSGDQSKRSFFSTVVLFFCWLPFALLLQCRAAFSSLLYFSTYALRVALLFGWPHVWLPGLLLT
jgi:hypothetical protein